MAHKIHVKPVPHINKNGEESKTKKDYVVTCRSRGKLCLSESASTAAAAQRVVESHRQEKFVAHRSNHPHDLQHVVKHEGVDPRTTKRQAKSGGGKPGLRYMRAIQSWRDERKKESAA